MLTGRRRGQWSPLHYCRQEWTLLVTRLAHVEKGPTSSHPFPLAHSTMSSQLPSTDIAQEASKLQANTPKRKWYGELTTDQKKAILKRRKQKYAEKKGGAGTFLPALHITEARALSTSAATFGAQANDAAQVQQTLCAATNRQMDRGKTHMTFYSSFEIGIAERKRNRNTKKWTWNATN